MRRYALSTLALAGIVAVGCQDLGVTNPNAPDRERALGNPEDVEALIASAWIPYWDRTQYQAWPYHAATAIAGVHQTSVANNGALSLSEIPRPLYDNNPTSDVSGLSRFPWYQLYSGLDNANEGLRAIANGLEIGADGADTHRAITFGRFAQGLMLGYVGLMWDQGFIADEDSDFEDPLTLEFYPYAEVIDAAVAAMEEAISLANQASFTVPNTWINGVQLSNVELARLAHSFIARFLVYSARYPEDRDAVDWAAVIEHTEAGITEDFVIPHENGQLGDPNWQRRIQQNLFNSHFADNWFLGRADVSGNFEDWLTTPLRDRQRFHVTTPDRRLTGAEPDSDGKYYVYRPTNDFRDERGTWRQSYYQYYRWDGEWEDARVVAMTVDEMNLLRAEAFARTGRAAEAAELVNITRVDNGELPPVTADGVPQSADCVPRTHEGQCEDLLGAIMWERMIEATGLESTRDWFDNRGWGTLMAGTFVHLPVPGRELDVLQMPIYSFGGEGNEGSAR